MMERQKIMISTDVGVELLGIIMPLLLKYCLSTKWTEISYTIS